MEFLPSEAREGQAAGPLLHRLGRGETAHVGAPLAPAYHAALAHKVPDQPVAFVNIGGVGNVTFVEGDGRLLAFDTGPGNALMDDWCFGHTGKPVDIDGALARTGTVDDHALARLRAHPFFQECPPKSLDRGSFTLDEVQGLEAAHGAEGSAIHI